MGVNEGMAGLAAIEEARRVVDVFRPVVQVLATAHAIRGNHRLATATGPGTNLGFRSGHPGTAGTGALTNLAERRAPHDPTPDA